MLEEVEDGKLVRRHDIGVRLGEHLAPGLVESRVENAADGRV